MAVRKPKGDGPFPAIVFFHGAPGGRGMPLDTTLHDALASAGKNVQMDVYEHAYHDFVLGNQGQKRQDLPKGEILLAGALEALENAAAFVKR